jgi:N-acetylneuraminic acid mutarotase
MRDPGIAPQVRTAIRTTVLRLLSIAVVLEPAAIAQAIDSYWTQTGDLNTPRYAHTATLLHNGKVLVAGGAGPNSCSTPTADAELYDPTSGKWSATGSLNTARFNHTATLLQSGEVLVTGGIGLQVSLDGAELYDPATEKWRPTGSFNAIRGIGSATLLPSNKVLAVGFSAGEVVSAELYDPATGTWSNTGAPSFVAANSHTVLLPDGKVLSVSEGSPWDYGDLLAELYDPATGQSSSAGYFNLFWAPSVTLLQNGKVLVTGLYGGNHPTQARLYDTYTGSWSSSGNLTTFRHYGGYSATPLADGRVLIAGGVDYIWNQPINAEELYDPTTGNWTRVSPLITSRYSHTATLLQDGRVLVAGGLEATLEVCNISLHSTELFNPGMTSTNSLDERGQRALEVHRRVNLERMIQQMPR